LSNKFIRAKVVPPTDSVISDALMSQLRSDLIRSLTTAVDNDIMNGLSGPVSAVFVGGPAHGTTMILPSQVAQFIVSVRHTSSMSFINEYEGLRKLGGDISFEKFIYK